MYVAHLLSMGVEMKQCCLCGKSGHDSSECDWTANVKIENRTKYNAMLTETIRKRIDGKCDRVVEIFSKVVE